jgi:alanine racemase
VVDLSPAVLDPILQHIAEFGAHVVSTIAEAIELTHAGAAAPIIIIPGVLPTPDGHGGA